MTSEPLSLDDENGRARDIMAWAARGACPHFKPSKSNHEICANCDKRKLPHEWQPDDEMYQLVDLQLSALARRGYQILLLGESNE